VSTHRTVRRSGLFWGSEGKIFKFVFSASIFYKKNKTYKHTKKTGGMEEWSGGVVE